MKERERGVEREIGVGEVERQRGSGDEGERSGGEFQVIPSALKFD